VNVVDSSGWIECFVGGPNAGFFAPPLEDPDGLLVPSITIFEVYRYVLREGGREEALAVVAWMRESRVIPVDGGLAVQAAETAARHRLPMADSIVYATALVHGASLWTQDADFEGLPGVEYRPRDGAI
jgi:predicted nucleic acid-binding protein